jgi:HEAT repeat protein
MGGPAAYDALVGRVDGDDNSYRLAVVRALRAVGDRRAVDTFISLSTDDDPEIRKSAAAALAHLLEAHRSSRFPARLREVLADDDIDGVIGAIAEGAPDVAWTESLNIRPRSLAKRAPALTRQRRHP